MVVVGFSVVAVTVAESDDATFLIGLWGDVCFACEFREFEGIVVIGVSG